MRRRRVVLAAVVAVLVAALPVAAQQSLTWTAGAVGGGWYAISGGMAELLREKAQLNIKVIPGGGVQNPPLVQAGEADLGMGLPPLLQLAMSGDPETYKGQKMPDLRALAGNMSLNTFHFYVAADSPFAAMTIEEIVKGKKPIRLAISKPGSSDVWVLEKMMEFYGLCSGKVDDCYKSWEAAGAKFFRGSYAEQAGAFKDRNVDGTFTFLALPGASVTEAAVGRKLKLLAFSEPLLAHLGKFAVGKGTIPAGTYPQAANGGETVVSAVMGTTITVSSKMKNELAYLITKTLNDNVDRVRKIHGSLADYDPAKGYLYLGAPLHPGAERYYREKGYLK